jgi:serine/threonine protein kinase/tetratricopeptide (TPR) repeat protein
MGWASSAGIRVSKTEAAVPLTAGARLAQYEILEAIGAGGMGEVYRARDLRLGRDVAIKVLPPHLTNDPDLRARFELEARAVAAISHPNIMAIHELAVVDDRPLAVVELLEGESLRMRLANGPLPWREAVQIGARVADGLAAAHAKGIVHRDLKPENIFLTTDGRPKILDFGLARSEPEADPTGTIATYAPTEPGRLLGTLGYMAPEQVRGEVITPATDIFALGCTLSEMLTGERPFARPTTAGAIAAVVHEPAPSVLASGREMPPRLAEIVEHCLAKDPAARFPFARDVAVALRSLLTDSTAIHTVARGRRGRVRSLAVLPFTMLEADPETEYLGDGVTESIINSLSQLPHLRVIPRTTVFTYKQRDVHPRSVGLALNVDTLVSGRVTRQDKLINVQAELIDVRRETQLWGDQYRYELANLVGLQEQIAWQISEALRMRLTGPEKKKLRRRSTENSAAYDEYLKGRHAWSKWSPEGFERAIRHYEQAIALDARYARAHAGLAETYGVMGYYGFLPPEIAMTRSSSAAYTAIDLEPGLAQAHTALALCRAFFYWDWIGAEHAFRRALDLDARHPATHMYYALLLVALGRYDEALAEARRGRELDPLSLLMQMGVAWTSYFSRRYQDALEALREVTLIEPGFPEAFSMLVIVYDRLGLFERAAETLSQGTRFFAHDVPSGFAGSLRDAAAAGGRAYWEARLRVTDDLAASGPMSNVAPYLRAVVRAQLGDIDAALEHVEEMIVRRLGQVLFLATDPGLDPLRTDPRFAQIVSRVGLPSPAATA